jgi:hypothetical protein
MIFTRNVLLFDAANGDTRASCLQLGQVYICARRSQRKGLYSEKVVRWSKAERNSKKKPLSERLCAGY